MKKKVLIVEDEEPLREVLTTILSEENIDVISKESGIGIEQTIETEKPDCVLMDVNLPQVNGDEITKKIKSNPSFQSVPIFLMSAVHDLPKKARAAKADGYFFKPFDMFEVISTVETV